MAIEPAQSAKLLAEADRLGKRLVSPTASLIGLASELGLEVWLKGSDSDPKAKNGFLEYTAPPRVLVCRQSGANFMRQLKDGDDAMLGRRGRFTLAHELGHWLAYMLFDTRPAAGRSEYWKDEDVMNKFAGRLVVPEWRLDSELAELKPSQGVHIQLLAGLALQLDVSKEVLASRVVSRRAGVGFLALRARRKVAAHFPDLIIEYSDGDPDLGLPRRPTVVRSERLFQKISAASTDHGLLTSFTFDGRAINPITCYVSWMRTSLSDSDGYRYWTSWSSSAFDRLTGEPNQELFFKPD